MQQDLTQQNTNVLPEDIFDDGLPVNGTAKNTGELAQSSAAQVPTTQVSAGKQARKKPGAFARFFRGFNQAMSELGNPILSRRLIPRVSSFIGTR